jgi:short-subunit dehydrogenase
MSLFLDFITRNMKDKIVLITGGSSGIGKALAFEFGRKGSRVVITARNEDRLRDVETELNEHGIEALAIPADSSKLSDNEKIIKKVVEQFGRLDVLINNAGISMRALFEDLDLEVFERLMNINFNGAVYMTKCALPHILKSGGSIVGISSINGHRGTPARTAYTASKFAMNGFFEALRTEVMKRGVHILVVSPGFTSSNIRNAALNAEGRSQGESPRNESKMMSSEEAARRIYRAVVKRKRDLVLTRKGKMAVFLNKFVPGILDRVVYNMMAKEPDSPLK